MANNDDIGWIYCLSNVSIVGQVKVGQTGNDPSERAKQVSGTGLPTPHKVEFAKKVNNYKQKERMLHKILTKYVGRTNPKREFFTCSPDDVKPLFELIDGEWFIPPKNTTETSKTSKTSKTEDTDLIECNIDPRLINNIFLLDGMDYKHIIKEKGFFSSSKSVKYGKYNKPDQVIICDKGKLHKTLHDFVISHYKETNSEKNSIDELNNLYYECRGKWIPILNLE